MISSACFIFPALISGTFVKQTFSLIVTSISKLFIPIYHVPVLISFWLSDFINERCTDAWAPALIPTVQHPLQWSFAKLQNVLPDPLSLRSKNAAQLRIRHSKPNLISTKYDHLKNPFPKAFNGDVAQETENQRMLAEKAKAFKKIPEFRRRVCLLVYHSIYYTNISSS